MKKGLTAGGGMILGLLVGAIFFDNAGLGMVFGLLIGAAVAGARRRRSVAPSSN